MADPNEDTAVADFLEILEEHRKNCERQGKYVEAEIAKNRLEELKLHEENRRRVSKSLPTRQLFICKGYLLITIYLFSSPCIVRRLFNRKLCDHDKLQNG